MVLCTEQRPENQVSAMRVIVARIPLSHAVQQHSGQAMIDGAEAADAGRDLEVQGRSLPGQRYREPAAGDHDELLTQVCRIIGRFNKTPGAVSQIVVPEAGADVLRVPLTARHRLTTPGTTALPPSSMRPASQAAYSRLRVVPS
jgi:hypothetical protein